jgi:TIR domain
MVRENRSLHIFVSYRRQDDIGFIERLVDNLRTMLGQESIARDLSDLVVGQDYRTELLRQVSLSTCLLVLIGHRWIQPTAGIGRVFRFSENRLFNRNDLVRDELLTARLKGVPILPVLMDGAKLPKRNDLPKDLQFLVDLQVHRLRRDPDFSQDVKNLAEACWDLRRIAKQPLDTARLPPVPADLILPLRTLVNSANRFRKGFLSLGAGADPKQLLEQHTEGLIAADQAISKWLEYFGEESILETEEEQVGEGTLLDQTARLIQFHNLANEALEKYDADVKRFNSRSAEMSTVNREEEIKCIVAPVGEIFTVYNADPEIFPLKSRQTQENRVLRCFGTLATEHGFCLRGSEDGQDPVET